MLLVLASACERQNPSPSTRARWDFLEAREFRGKAEVALYQGTVVRYGENRQADLALITVLEPYIKKQMVKSETETDYYAIKQNQALKYTTGVYPYSQMNSLFWERDSGSFLKATMTTQEWCGQSYKELRSSGQTMQFFYSSYWENESRGYETRKSPAGDAVLYDELPLLVRRNQISNGTLMIFPMLMSSQVRRPDWDIGQPARDPEYRPATLEVTQDTLDFQGQQRRVRVVRILQEGFSTDSGAVSSKEDVFYVDLESPLRPLLRWERNDGGVFELQSLNYTDYWNQNNPQDRLPENPVPPL